MEENIIKQRLAVWLIIWCRWMTKKWTIQLKNKEMIIIINKLKGNNKKILKFLFNSNNIEQIQNHKYINLQKNLINLINKINKNKNKTNNSIQKKQIIILTVQIFQMTFKSTLVKVKIQLSKLLRKIHWAMDLVINKKISSYQQIQILSFNILRLMNVQVLFKRFHIPITL